MKRNSMNLPHINTRKYFFKWQGFNFALGLSMVVILISIFEMTAVNAIAYQYADTINRGNKPPINQQTTTTQKVATSADSDAAILHGIIGAIKVEITEVVGTENSITISGTLTNTGENGYLSLYGTHGSFGSGKNESSTELYDDSNNRYLAAKVQISNNEASDTIGANLANGVATPFKLLFTNLSTASGHLQAHKVKALILRTSGFNNSSIVKETEFRNLTINPPRQPNKEVISATGSKKAVINSTGPRKGTKPTFEEYMQESSPDSASSEPNTDSEKQPTNDQKKIYEKRDSAEEIFGSSVEVKPRILSKDKPGYTEEARANKIQGVVVLSVVFRRDGTVSDIEVVRGLGYGLDEEAVKAATKIKFTPGSNKGQPVNVRLRVEFTFSFPG